MEVIEEPAAAVVPENADMTPYVEITEQPAPHRFRYECEGRSAGSLVGVSSTQDNQTYPTIKIHGYVGPATVNATCITKEGLLVHPYELRGRNCYYGLFSGMMNVTDDAREYQFRDIAIQCVRKKDMPAILADRRQKQIDPFQKGYAHADNVSDIEVDGLRLAIQVAVMNGKGIYYSLQPVFTQIIHNKGYVNPRLIRYERKARELRVREERKARVRREREERIARARELERDKVVEEPAIIPYVEITEQPAPRDLRFRYECERRSKRSLRGVLWTEDHKTYPTIKIHGYVGRATITATCITEEGLLVHPYALTGTNCTNGVLSVPVNITDDAREYHFEDLRIQCVKKRDVQTILLDREWMRIDPFQRGFAHITDMSRIDQHAVRLAIQVMVQDDKGRNYGLQPVFTDVIYNYAAPTPSEEQAIHERERRALVRELLDRENCNEN